MRKWIKAIQFKRPRVATVNSDAPGHVPDKETTAAVKIQSFFRGHLARQAFRALKGVVKLQAMARGASVRKQTTTALHCMSALARLHVRVRARRFLQGDKHKHDSRTRKN